MKKEKILLFYLKTGGGHYSTAKALYTYYKTYHSDTIEPVLIDGLEGAQKISKFFIEDGYQIVQKKQLQNIYKTFYLLNETDPVANTTLQLLNVIVTNHLEKVFMKEQPDRIINLHFLLIKPIEELYKKYNLDFPLTTIVTDPYTAHSLWFKAKHSNYIVYSKNIKKHIPKGRHCCVCNPIFNEKFTQTPDKRKMVTIMKNYLPFKNKNKNILVVGGGDGLNKSYNILKHIHEQQLEINLSIVCGKNKSLYKKLQTYIKKHDIQNCILYEFVDFMYELMNSHDFIITKGGPATIMEILACQKIPIITSYIWKQELGNVEYVTKNKLGIYQPDVKKILTFIDSLTPAKINQYQERIKKQKIQSGTKEIAELILKE